MALNGDEPDPQPEQPAQAEQPEQADGQEDWRDRREWHIADLLVDARKARKWSQGDLALRLPRPDGAPPRVQSFVAKIETRDRRLTFTEGFDICRILGVSAQAIFDEGAARTQAERDGSYVREAPGRHVRRGRPRKDATPGEPAGSESNLDPRAAPAPVHPSEPESESSASLEGAASSTDSQDTIRPYPYGRPRRKPGGGSGNPSARKQRK